MRVRTIRPGRKVQWIEAALLDGDDREVTRATVLRLRSDDVDTSGSVGIVAERAAAARRGQPAAGVRRPDRRRVTGARTRCGSWAATGSRPAPASRGSGCAVRSSPAKRCRACSRAAAAADFGSGVGNPLRLTHATGINADVTIAMHRHPVGEWVCLESGAWANPHGVGLAETRLHDEQGAIGRAVQTLLVESIDQRPSPRANRRQKLG